MNSPEKLSQEYQLRFARMKEYRDAVWKVLVASYFQPLIDSPDRVLDLGCGWGEFINHLSAPHRYGMDLNEDSARHLQSDVTFLHQDCSQPWPLETGSLDVVFTSNFLEHLPDKSHVERALLEAHRCLRPGGRLICMGPNIRFVPGAYWDFWDHFVPVSDRSLAEILRLSGFDVTRQVARFLPYSMSDRRPPPLIFLRLYLRLKFVWPLFGKQFLVIAEASK